MIEAIVPDIPDVGLPHVVQSVKSEMNAMMPHEFARAIDGASASLESAQNAEDAFASGSGSLVDAMYERARADLTLSVATAATGRILQDVQSLLTMQV